MRVAREFFLSAFLAILIFLIGITLVLYFPGCFGKGDCTTLARRLTEAIMLWPTVIVASVIVAFPVYIVGLIVSFYFYFRRVRSWTAWLATSTVTALIYVFLMHASYADGRISLVGLLVFVPTGFLTGFILRYRLFRNDPEVDVKMKVEELVSHTAPAWRLRHFVFIVGILCFVNLFLPWSTNIKVLFFFASLFLTSCSGALILLDKLTAKFIARRKGPLPDANSFRTVVRVRPMPSVTIDRDF